MIDVLGQYMRRLTNQYFNPQNQLYRLSYQRDGAGDQIFKVRLPCDLCHGSGMNGVSLCSRCNGNRDVTKEQVFYICKTCNGSGVESNLATGLRGICRSCQGGGKGYRKPVEPPDSIDYRSHYSYWA